MSPVLQAARPGAGPRTRRRDPGHAVGARRPLGPARALLPLLLAAALALPAQARGPLPPAPSWLHPAGDLDPGLAPLDEGGGLATDLPLTEEETAWLRTAWAYFAGPAPQPPSQAPAQPAAQPTGQTGQQPTAQPAPEGAPAAAPPPASTLLVPVRSGTNVATAWSIADQTAALLLARRTGILDAREFDRRFSRFLEFLNRMPLGPDGMPNRFYAVDSGQTLGQDLQPGVAGWSAVDTGRLLLWLRIASEAHPEFAPFIRNAVARLSVCRVLSDNGRLQQGNASPEGTQVAPETNRGYDAPAAQGYRAWGLDLPIREAAESYPFEIDIQGLLFPVAEDVSNQPPVMTTPPAYLLLETGPEPLGGRADEVAGGRTAEALMQAVAEVQASRYGETGLPTARADFRRSDDPTTVIGTILANGYAWSVVTPDGALRQDLALLSTRAAFALDTLAPSDHSALLVDLVAELRDPGAGWYEGRYEGTGAYEQTRTAATNAFVMEALAFRHLGPLFPEEARPEQLQPIAAGPDGACRLPLAVAPAPL